MQSHQWALLLSRCPAAQAYGHAYELASCYAELPMGVEVLVQIDRLVQLLETPVFNFLRLHLLHPARFPALLWCAAVCIITAAASMPCLSGAPLASSSAVVLSRVLQYS